MKRAEMTYNFRLLGGWLSILMTEYRIDKRAVLNANRLLDVCLELKKFVQTICYHRNKLQKDSKLLFDLFSEYELHGVDDWIT
jgi:hypothetical protein